MGVVAALTQNLTSKFYMKGIIETASFMLGDEAMKSKAPDRIGTSIFARALYKVFPLSGGLRYGSRVDADVQQELWTLSDRLKQLDPFEWVSDKHTIMPQRNMFGEPINRQNGWLFGLGEKSGLWSSPFAMTEWSNPAIGKFFQDRDFDFRKPSPIDRKSKIDLRTIVNNATKQTAYDRWRELTGEVKLTYKGKKYNLKGDRSIALSWEGYDSLIAGSVSFNEADYKGTLILSLPNGDGECNGSYSLQKDGKGTWQIGCTNNMGAAGTLKWNEINGVIGSGRDHNDKKVKFTVAGKS
jgi:hypothetical protein